MKIQITKCDKCGKEIKDNETMNVLSLDLCMNCYDLCLSAIQSWIDKKEPETVPVSKTTPEEVLAKRDWVSESCNKVLAELNDKKSNKKRDRIDWDRACYLKRQGKRNAEIAAELGVNVGTVNATIYKEMVKRERK